MLSANSVGEETAAMDADATYRVLIAGKYESRVSSLVVLNVVDYKRRNIQKLLYHFDQLFTGCDA
jgi:hypothetical protein